MKYICNVKFLYTLKHVRTRRNRLEKTLYTASTVYRARRLARRGQIITVHEIATRRVINTKHILAHLHTYQITLQDYTQNKDLVALADNNTTRRSSRAWHPSCSACFVAVYWCRPLDLCDDSCLVQHSLQWRVDQPEPVSTIIHNCGCSICSR